MRLTLAEVVDLQAYRRERSHRSLVSTVQATMRCSEAEAEWLLRLIIDRAEDIRSRRGRIDKSKGIIYISPLTVARE